MIVPVLSLPNIRGETYLDAPWCALDLEVTNNHYGDARVPANRVVCVSWMTGHGDTIDKPVQNYYGPDWWRQCPEFRQDLEATKAAGGYGMAFNAKYECHWLLREGFHAPDMLWADPMLWEWALLGNNPRRQPLALSYLALKYGAGTKDPFVDALIKGGVCPSRIPRQLLVDRCSLDVVSMVSVAREQLHLLQQRKQLHLAAQRSLLAPVLAAMERNPITLHKGRVLATHAAYTVKHAGLAAEYKAASSGLEKLTGTALLTLLYGIHPHVPRKPPYKRPRKDKLTGQVMLAPSQAPCLCPSCSPRMASQLKAQSLGFTEIMQRGKPKRGMVTVSWPDGRPLANKRVLDHMLQTATTDKQLNWLRLRGALGQAFAALSKNLDFYKGVVLERGGQFYVNIRQATTATHRLSGQGWPQAFDMFKDPKTGVAPEKSVQSQNTPREFKCLQTAGRPEHGVSGADGKQLEFRGAAFLGQDPVAMADIVNPDFDAHLQTLTVMLNGVYDRVLYGSLLQRYRDGDKQVKFQRNDNQLCKSHTYKPLFGGETGTPVQEAYYTWFREHYHGITEECTRWLKQVEESARRDPRGYKNLQGNWCGTGEFRAASGLIFRFDVEFRQRGRTGEWVAYDRRSFKPVKPAVFNYPVQNLATGEGMPIAVICLYHRVHRAGLRAYLTNTVHDSADAEVHAEDWPAYQAEALAAFTTDVKEWFTDAYGIDFNVPLGADVSFGEFLGEGETVSYDTK